MVKQLFQSEQREYELDPTKVLEIMSDLERYVSEVPKGVMPKILAELYLRQEGAIIPYQLSGQPGHLDSISDYYGKEFVLRTNYKETSGETSFLKECDLARLVMDADGSRVTLTVNRLANLMIDPNPLYQIGNKYLRKDSS